MTSATHVVHLIGSLDVGGAETVSLELCRALPTTDVQHTFVCLSGRRGTLAEEFEAVGARVVPLRWSAPAFPTRLRALLRGTFAADVVTSHVSLASGPLLLWARCCGVRVRVARFHSQADGRGSGPGRRMYRSVMRMLVALNATHVLGVTESSTEFGLGRMRVVARALGVVVDVLPNGVDPDRFAPTDTPPPPEPLSVLHVGRASPEKNRAALVPIHHSLSSLGPVTTRLVGSENTADIGSGAEVLTILGATSDVPAQLHSAHVVVLPSIWEGLPTVVLEALSCDVAVVVSDLPGLREIARQTSGVTLVHPQAAPDVWAGAIRRAAMESGRGRIRRDLLSSTFTLPRTVELWRAVWCRP